jgi:hypothetical protein
MTDIEICQRDVYIRFLTPQFGCPAALLQGPDIRNKADRRAVLKGWVVDEWRLTTMTTEIINIAGQIGQWLNVLVARQIAAQAAKLPH